MTIMFVRRVELYFQPDGALNRASAELVEIGTTTFDDGREQRAEHVINAGLSVSDISSNLDVAVGDMRQLFLQDLAARDAAKAEAQAENAATEAKRAQDEADRLADIAAGRTEPAADA